MKADAPLPDMASGKADGLSVVMRGDMGFGDEGARQSTIPPVLRFDAYEIQMAEGGIATFEVSQRGTSRGFDSLLYIYGPRQENGTYVDEVVARDDDNGWGLLSRVRDFEAIEGGTYMLVVGTFEGEGQYRIYGECENGACEPEVPSGES